MANNSTSFVEELARVFWWVLAACGFFAVGIVYLEWRVDDRLRYRAPAETLVALDQDTFLDEPLLSRQPHAVYVPVYSHVFHQDGRPLLLTVTLSVRNTDRDREIVLTSVRYYDSGGREVRSHLQRPLRLEPLSTAEFLVERDDTISGSGASFIVEWAADETVTAPVIESVMIDSERRHGIAFARRGLVAATTQRDKKAEGTVAHPGSVHRPCSSWPTPNRPSRSTGTGGCTQAAPKMQTSR